MRIPPLAPTLPVLALAAGALLLAGASRAQERVPATRAGGADKVIQLDEIGTPRPDAVPIDRGRIRKTLPADRSPAGRPDEAAGPKPSKSRAPTRPGERVSKSPEPKGEPKGGGKGGGQPKGGGGGKKMSTPQGAPGGSVDVDPRNARKGWRGDTIDEEETTP